MRISDWSSDVCSSDLDSARDFGVRRCGDHLRDRAPHPSACSNQSDARHGLAPFVLSCLMTPMDDIRNIVILTGAGISRSEEHTSELQSLMRISYAVFCLKKKN